MAIKAVIESAEGANKLKIGPEGEAFVVIHPHPPKDEYSAPIPFRSYFLDSSGSNEMRVDGSTTPVLFSIEASNDRDIYINSCSVVIADAGATLNNFGNIGALTNGVGLEWETQDFGNRVIHEGLISNFDFIRLSGGVPAFGNGSSSFRANNVQGNSEGFIPFIDFQEIFGLQWGLRLRKGTKDKLSFIVRDDVTGVDAFNVIAYGIEF